MGLAEIWAQSASVSSTVSKVRRNSSANHEPRIPFARPWSMSRVYVERCSVSLFREVSTTLKRPMEYDECNDWCVESMVSDGLIRPDPSLERKEMLYRVVSAQSFQALVTVARRSRVSVCKFLKIIQCRRVRHRKRIHDKSKGELYLEKTNGSAISRVTLSMTPSEYECVPPHPL